MNLFARKKSLVQDTSHKALNKTLSWPHLIAMGIGAIIGMGIFTLTGLGAGLAGPGVILSFALAGIVCAFAALAYAEVATLIPTSGSAYTYTYSVLGEVLAWIVGWSLILEYALGCSAVAVGWSAHVMGFLHGTLHFDLPLALQAGLLDHGVVNLLAVVIVVAITGLLLLGTRESAVFNIILVAIKMIALGAFIYFAAPAIKSGNYHPFMPFGFWAHQVGEQKLGVMAAAAIMFFAFYGFDAVSTSAEETKNPARDLTIGILGSMLVCTILYMSIAACVVGVLPYQNVANSHGEPLPYILRLLGHPMVAALVGGAAILALPSVILVFMYGQSRILFVMARDGLIPKGLASVDGRGVPALMTIITGVFIAIFAGFVPLKQITEMANAGTLLAFIAVSLAMIILRKTHPQLKREFKTPFYYIVGPLAIIGCVFLFTSLTAFTMKAFLIWNLIGLVAYFSYGFWKSPLRKKA